MESIRMFLGVPQTTKIAVYTVPLGRKGVVRQMVFTNTDQEDSKLTITINTVDIMKDFVIKAGETKVIETLIVLDQSDSLSLQQEKLNAINAIISGTLE